jgi:hypothetical protein
MNKDQVFIANITSDKLIKKIPAEELSMIKLK